MAPKSGTKTKKAAPSSVAVFGRVKTQLGTIGDALVCANVVNHILNKRLFDDLGEALEVYADPEEKARIMSELGFAVNPQLSGN